MKKEEQVQEIVSDIEEQEAEAATEFEEEYGDMIPVPGLMVKREKYSKKGKDYWSYRIDTTLRGQKTHIDFRMGEDIGAYRLLDIIFLNRDTVQFAVQPYKTKNQTTKQVNKGFTYFAVDPDDIMYRTDLRPAQQSDKRLIELVLAEISRDTGLSFEA